jgi:hypothetical protein
MGNSSFPSYPPPLPSRSNAVKSRPKWHLTPRQHQVLVDLIWLAGIVILLVWLRQVATTLRQPPPPKPVPLPFRLVVQRFDRVEIGMSEDEAFTLLGPQRFAQFREPEMEAFESWISFHPDRYPSKWYWAKWADPADPSRWMALLIGDGQVVHKLKKKV